jgi:hypothetical protein
MIKITCRGESPSEAKVKCMVTKILLTQETIPTDMVIGVLNTIGGIYIKEIEG